MKTRIVRIGNSQGIRIPKALLEQAGLQGEVESRLQALEDEKEHSWLVGALEKAELRFESEHPNLGEALRNAIEVLSAGGI